MKSTLTKMKVSYNKRVKSHLNLVIMKQLLILFVLVSTLATSCVNKERIKEERRQKMIDHTETLASIQSSGKFDNEFTLTELQETFILSSCETLDMMYWDAAIDKAETKREALKTLEWAYHNYVVYYTQLPTASVEQNRITFYEALLRADKAGLKIKLYDPSVGYVYESDKL